MGENIEERIKEIEAQREVEEKINTRNAYELAALLFANILTKDNLNKFIEELANLKYPADSAEEGRRLELLRVFTEMKDFFNKSS